jgi:hypothetical protein
MACLYKRAIKINFNCLFWKSFWIITRWDDNCVSYVPDFQNYNSKEGTFVRNSKTYKFKNKIINTYRFDLKKLNSMSKFQESRKLTFWKLIDPADYF